jgi:lysine-specific demethylase 8
MTPGTTIAHHGKWASRLITEVNADKWRDVAEQARSAAIPLVVRNFISPQAKLWSPERMVGQWGSSEVDVAVDLPSHGVPYREQFGSHQKRMKLADFVELMQSGQSCYLTQVPLNSFPELDHDLNVKDLRLGRVFSRNLWVGNNTRSGLHFDNADNLFCQLYGAKRALLVGPKHSKFLYPFADNPSKSQVDLDCPDFARQPKSARIEVWGCQLNAGDALYIPRGWWHYISTADISISINCWHGDALSAFERLRMFLSGGLRVVGRASYDFFWHGVFGRPYSPRLFSPIPPGMQAYNRMKARFK